MIRSRLAEPSIHPHLGRAFIAIAALSGAVMAMLGVRFGMVRAQNSQALEATTLARSAIKDARATVLKAEAVAPSGNSPGISTANRFQRALMESARVHGCSVREVTLSADLTAYTSRYQSETPKSEFMQGGFHAVLTGAPQGVVSTLEDLAEGAIPFEFDSIQFTRTSVGQGGTMIDAVIDLRVLTKEAAK